MASSGANDPGLIRRLAAACCRAVFLLLLLHASTFVVFDILPEATYARLGSAAVNRQVLERTREQLGLEGSAAERYLRSLRNTIRLDLGSSLQSGYPVSRLLASRAQLSLPTILAATCVAGLAAAIAAWLYSSRTLSITKRVLLELSPALLLPQFAAATILAIAATMFGTTSRSRSIADFLLVLSVAAMPAGILFMAAARSAREACGARFALAYEARGFSWQQIRVILQSNIWLGLAPLCNRLVLSVVTGTVFAELAFDRPGIGALLADAIRAGDQPLASGWMLGVSGPLILISQFASALTRSLPAS